MTHAIRISTTPPDGWDGNPDEMAFYCDLREDREWRAFPLLRRVASQDRAPTIRTGVAGYVVADAFAGREVGLLVRVEDGHGEVAYHGVDHLGRMSVEPSANEAAWAMANAGRDLDDDHKLPRGGGH